MRKVGPNLERSRYMYVEDWKKSKSTLISKQIIQYTACETMYFLPRGQEPMWPVDHLLTHKKL